MTNIATIRREMETEQRIRAMDTYEIVEEIHNLEDRNERLEEALTAIVDNNSFEGVPGMAYRNVAKKALAEPSLNNNPDK